MKANIYLIIVSLFLLSTGCTSHRPDDLFTLQGRTVGIDTGRVIISYPDTTNRMISDTARIENGRFSFRGFIKQPTRTLVSVCGRGRYLYFEPRDMTLTADTNHFIQCSLTGSKTEEINDKFTMIAMEQVEYFREIASRKKEIDDRLQKTTDKAVRDSLETRMELLREKETELKNKMDHDQNRILLDNPSYLTLLKYDRFDEFPVDSQKAILANLPEPIRNYPAVKEIEKTFPLKVNSLKGSTAPGFTTLDIKGVPVSLSDFKGKVVLLDFWASWCPPCRMSIPHLKELYQQHHDRGFDIIAVSYDTDANAWKQAIDEEKTGAWHHVLNVQEMGKTSPDDIRNQFYVVGLPTQLLIGPDGKIIGRWTGLKDESVRSLDQLLNEQLK